MSVKNLIIFCFLFVWGDVHSQIDTEFQIKDRSFTGLRTGLNLGNNFFEIGIGHILIDKPCNRDGGAFRPTCSFPKRLEIDFTYDFGFSNQTLDAQKLTLLYTPFAMKFLKDFGHKYIYYSVGHVIAGASLINYTDFSKNFITPQLEIGWMSPERIGLGRRNKKHKYELDFRVTYARNFESVKQRSYGINLHQIQIMFLFLFNPNTH